MISNAKTPPPEGRFTHPFHIAVGSKAFARYRDIDEDMKKELVSLLD